MIRLVLWDIDGTLVHAGDVAGDVFEDVIERVTGVRPPTRVRMSGKTDPQITMEYLAMIGIEEREDALREVLQTLPHDLVERRDLMREQGRVLPGVIETLDAIATLDGVEQTLLTGNLKVNARTKLEVFGLDHRFDFSIGAFGSDHHDRTTLVPIALQRVQKLRHLDVSPHEVLVIGDSPNDYACAFAVGAQCALVATGRSTVDELSALGAELVLADLTNADQVISMIAA